MQLLTYSYLTKSRNVDNIVGTNWCDSTTRLRNHRSWVQRPKCRPSEQKANRTA